MKNSFIGFYDKNGKRLNEGDKVRATVTHATTIYSSKGRDIPSVHLFEIVRSKRSPEFYLKDLGPEVPLTKPIPPSYRHTLLPRFEAYPKSMFWKQPDGKRANQWHYDKISHLRSDVRYLAMPDIEKV